MSDKHADCGCGCDGAGTCQVEPDEKEQPKPRYRSVGVVHATELLALAKRVLDVQV